MKSPTGNHSLHHQTTLTPNTMEAKLIKEQMTQGEWVRMGYKVTQYTSDEGNKLLALCESADFSTVTDYSNASAIVSAVNNTWNHNINPEFVPAAFDLIKRLSEKHHDGNPATLIEEAKALIPLLKL